MPQDIATLWKGNEMFVDRQGQGFTGAAMVDIHAYAMRADNSCADVYLACTCFPMPNSAPAHSPATGTAECSLRRGESVSLASAQFGTSLSSTGTRIFLEGDAPSADILQALKS